MRSPLRKLRRCCGHTSPGGPRALHQCAFMGFAAAWLRWRARCSPQTRRASTLATPRTTRRSTPRRSDAHDRRAHSCRHLPLDAGADVNADGVLMQRHRGQHAAPHLVAETGQSRQRNGAVLNKTAAPPPSRAPSSAECDNAAARRRDGWGTRRALLLRHVRGQVRLSDNNASSRCKLRAARATGGRSACQAQRHRRPHFTLACRARAASARTESRGGRRRRCFDAGDRSRRCASTLRPR